MPFRSHLRMFLVLAILAIAALSLVACGDDDDATDPTPAATATSGAATTPTTNGSSTQEPSEDPTTEGPSGEITIYSGRAEELVGPIIERFEEETGVSVRVRYGSTPELAAAILEEGSRSPADIYLGQDAGSVGVLSQNGMFSELPESILSRVPSEFSAGDGTWVGLSGRLRVVVYNTDIHSEEALPDSILDYTDPAWSGKIGWAPTNASFQSFVTAMRVHLGEDVAREWLEGIVANNPAVFSGNGAILTAVANGEVEVGFVNHYYLGARLRDEGEGFKARNYYFTNGDIGGLMNVAGVGVLKSSSNVEAAHAFIEFMLSEEAQSYFAEETFEIPLIEGVAPPADFVPEVGSVVPVDVDLTSLGDLEATVELLQSVGALP
jgi:iron(III) transport system substrate-binding protein